MGCLTVSATMIHSAFTLSFTEFNKETNYQAAGMAATAMVFSLGILLGVHTFILGSNTSTLEMDVLWGGNPFSRKKRVLKSKTEK